MKYYCIGVRPLTGEVVDFEVCSKTSRDRTDELLSFLQQQTSWTVVREEYPVLDEDGNWTELGDVLDWAFGSIEFKEGVLRFHN